MKRRQFGAIRQLPSGRWQARYRHPITNRVIPGPETFATKADAGRWLATIEADLARGRYVDPFAGRELLSTFAERWLKERPLRPRTVELYRGLLDRYVLADLGTVPLQGITPGVVRTWHADLLSQGRPGQVTVAKAYRLLHAICATATED
jgi:hypothetical protein